MAPSAISTRTSSQRRRRLARRQSAFVESLDLEYNSHTTQIEPHDWIAEYCDALADSM